MKIKKHPYGFGLIELLIVIILFTVAASAAVPTYQAIIEKSRKSEAVRVLSAIRQSELRYFDGARNYTSNLSQLDFNPVSGAGGQRVFFTFSVPSASSSGFVAQALRNNTSLAGSPYVIEINQAGLTSERPAVAVPAPLPLFIKSIVPSGASITPLAQTLIDKYLKPMNTSYSGMAVTAVPLANSFGASGPTPWIRVSSTMGTTTYRSFPDPSDPSVAVYLTVYESMLKPGVNMLSVSDLNIWNKTTGESWIYSGNRGQLYKSR